jgi:hypothetical protein
MKNLRRESGMTRTRRLTAAIEGLELRQLLSAVLGTNGTLTVTGTGGNDQIQVEYSTHGLSSDSTADTVIVNGVSQAFDVPAVKSIVVNALAGNDSVIVTGRVDDFQAGAEAVNVSVSGGDGNDTITVNITSEPDSSPATSAYIDAGAGNDSISYASTYAATLHGGDGNDTIRASSDDQVLHVAMYGDNGDDQFIAGNYDGGGYGGCNNVRWSWERYL